jgi:sugar lactone lactonase YvrE
VRRELLLIRAGLWAAIVCATATAATAVSPVLWTLESFEDFEPGRAEGAALTAAGELVLAPAVRPLRVPPLEEASEPFLWSQAIDSKGSLYIGGGQGGRIYRVPRGGQGAVYFETGDLGVHALAVDRSDVLYAATLPQGKVFRITGEGKGEVWYQPEDRYIWALAINPKGEVFAATGERGIIYRIAGKGKAETFFDSDEFHVVSLAFDAQGNLIAGTDGRGLLYRITPEGRATVLHDSRLREVHLIGLDAKGVIFAGAMGVEGEPPAPLLQAPRLSAREGDGAPAQVQPPLPLPGAEVPATATVTVVAAATAAPTQAAPPPKSEVCRIEPDGTVTTIWSSQEEVVHSLVIDPAGRPVIGTGDPGRIRVLSGSHQHSLLALLPESQVTSLALGTSQQVFAATSNAGRVYLLDPATGDSGTYVSPARDGQAVSRWGRIAWRASLPQGSKLELSTRSGNSSPPDGTWSEWSTPYGTADGSPVTSPPGRFLQWRARLLRTGSSPGPTLHAVSVAYVPANLPPDIRKVTVHPPGVVRERTRILQEPDPLDLAFTGIRVGADGAPAPGIVDIASDKKIYVRGMRALEWEVEDPNGDTLAFDLSFRGEDETAWKPLARALREPYFAFDSMQLPDGLYRVRIEASDTPSNPGPQSRSAQRVTDPFMVDTTPPTVQVTARRSGRDATLEVTATDTIGPLARAAWSLDAAAWVPIVPADGMADARTETYSAPLGALKPGEHTVIVRVTDLLGNTGAGKATFVVE